MIALSVAVAAYLTALAGLIFISGNRRLFCYYTAAKAAVSGGFLAVALLAFAVGGRRLGGRFWLLFAAMALCAAGDVLLGLANNGRGHPLKDLSAGAVLLWRGASGLLHLLRRAAAPVVVGPAAPPRADRHDNAAQQKGAAAAAPAAGARLRVQLSGGG